MTVNENNEKLTSRGFSVPYLSVFQMQKQLLTSANCNRNNCNLEFVIVIVIVTVSCNPWNEAYEADWQWLLTTEPSAFTIKDFVLFIEKSWDIVDNFLKDAEDL